MHKIKLLPSLILAFTFNSMSLPAKAHHSPLKREKPNPEQPLAASERRQDRYASIVIHAETGDVLYARDAQQKLHPASTTKIMTAYITFKAMKEGKLRPKQKLPVSSHAASRMRTNLSMMTHYKTKMVTLPDGRKKRQLYYRQTVTDITTEDALRGLIIQSANDAAVVLAEKIGGSEKKFVAMMNATAQELGMTNTTFANPHGLPDNRQISTVEDMAKLSAALIRDFPEYYHYFSETRFTYRGHTYHNHNRLLGAYEGMDGLKTGYISSSGNHLSASAKRGENRVIAVVFGAAGRAQIVNDIPQLLDFGFRKLRDPAATFILDGPQTPPPPPVDKPPAGDDDETDFGKPEQVLRTSSRTPRPV